MPEELTRQEQLFGVRDAEFGAIVAQNDRLYPFFRVARQLASEAKVDPTDGGLRVEVVDSANTCMVRASVDLLTDVLPKETFGVNTKQLAGHLQNKPRDAEVKIECAIPNGLLRLNEQFANGRVWNIRERIGFLDPKSIRERPDIPDLEHDVTVDLDANDLMRIVGRLPNDSPIEFKVDDGELAIGSLRKSTDDEDGQYYGLATTEYDGDGEASALYDPEYLSDIMAGIDAIDAETVTLSWADEFPIQINAAGEYVDTEWFLAPRVRRD